MKSTGSSVARALIVLFYLLLAIHWFGLGFLAWAGTSAGIVYPGEDDVAWRTDSFGFLLFAIPLFVSSLFLMILAVLLPIRHKLVWIMLCMAPPVAIALLRWYKTTHYPMWD